VLPRDYNTGVFRRNLCWNYLCVDEVLRPFILLPLSPGSSGIPSGVNSALGEPVVPRGIWVSPMKLPEFLQTPY